MNETMNEFEQQLYSAFERYDSKRKGSKMTTIELIAKGDDLYTKFADISDDLQREYWFSDNEKLRDPILLYQYPEGDCDTINAEKPNIEHMRSALYDARESGLIPHDTTTAILPGGQSISIDE